MLRPFMPTGTRAARRAAGSELMGQDSIAGIAVEAYRATARLAKKLAAARKQSLALHRQTMMAADEGRAAIRTAREALKIAKATQRLFTEADHATKWNVRREQSEAESRKKFRAIPAGLRVILKSGSKLILPWEVISESIHHLYSPPVLVSGGEDIPNVIIFETDSLKGRVICVPKNERMFCVHFGRTRYEDGFDVPQNVFHDAYDIMSDKNWLELRPAVLNRGEKRPKGTVGIWLGSLKSS
jgi:hypothetical protein